MCLCDTCKNIKRVEVNGWPIVKKVYYCQIYGHTDPVVRCVDFQKGDPVKRGVNNESSNL